MRENWFLCALVLQDKHFSLVGCMWAWATCWGTLCRLLRNPALEGIVHQKKKMNPIIVSPYCHTWLPLLCKTHIMIVRLHYICMSLSYRYPLMWRNVRIVWSASTPTWRLIGTAGRATNGRISDSCWQAWLTKTSNTTRRWEPELNIKQKDRIVYWNLSPDLYSLCWF